LARETLTPTPLPSLDKLGMRGEGSRVHPNRRALAMRPELSWIERLPPKVEAVRSVSGAPLFDNKARIVIGGGEFSFPTIARCSPRDKLPGRAFGDLWGTVLNATSSRIG
jgi:hypothetical protein